MWKLAGLAGVISAHSSDSSHKYKAEYNPPDDTFPTERINSEVLIPKGNFLFLHLRDNY